MPGRCDGALVEVIEESPGNIACLRDCQADSDCKFWSYLQDSETCILTSTCPFLDTSCGDDCTFGQSGCREYLFHRFIIMDCETLLFPP